MKKLKAWCFVPIVMLDVFFATSIVQCHPEPLAVQNDDAKASQVIDDSLMAFLSMARAHHHLSDLHEDNGETQKAIDMLERLIQKAPTRSSAEVDEVMADTFARLSDLRSRLGAFTQALSDVQEGLKRAPVGSYFEGHLHEVRGHVEERWSKQLDKDQKKSEAKAARLRAIEAFEKAIAIQSEVIRKKANEQQKVKPISSELH